jgi:maltooligosyltrehalose synthase
VILAPRLYGALCGGGGLPLGADAWGDTAVDLAPLAQHGDWHQALTDERIASQGAPAGASLRAADALRSFPVAVLLPADGP